jgi:hypothetical protein
MRRSPFLLRSVTVPLCQRCPMFRKIVMLSSSRLYSPRIGGLLNLWWRRHNGFRNTHPKTRHCLSEDLDPRHQHRSETRSFISLNERKIFNLCFSKKTVCLLSSLKNLKLDNAWNSDRVNLALHLVCLFFRHILMTQSLCLKVRIVVFQIFCP